MVGQLPLKQKVTGSSPVSRTNNASFAKWEGWGFTYLD